MAEEDESHSEIETMTTRFMAFAMARITIFSLPVFVVGSSCRPLWRKWVQKLIAKSERQGSKEPENLAFNRINLIYEARGSWQDVVPYLDDLDQKKLTTRMQLSSSFALLYLHNGRLAEALQAANDWVTVSGRWVEKNVDNPRKVIKLHRTLPTWYLRSQQKATVVWSERSGAVLQEIHSLSKGVVKQHRDAKVALSLLLWAQQQERHNAFNLISKRSEINPFVPSPKRFDYELAIRLGMPDGEFDRICTDAEKFESHALR